MSTCYTSAACAACSSDLGHRASQPSAERGRQYVGIYTAFGDDLSERGRRGCRVAGAGAGRGGWLRRQQVLHMALATPPAKEGIKSRRGCSLSKKTDALRRATIMLDEGGDVFRAAARMIRLLSILLFGPIPTRPPAGEQLQRPSLSDPPKPKGASSQKAKVSLSLVRRWGRGQGRTAFSEAAETPRGCTKPWGGHAGTGAAVPFVSTMSSSRNEPRSVKGGPGLSWRLYRSGWREATLH